ncbi:MAG: DUF5060 domain-containing protein [Planctomycetaceae bacterium]
MNFFGRSIVLAILFATSLDAAQLRRDVFAGKVPKWGCLTLKIEGPATSETAAPNPFTDFRLLVQFTHKETGVTKTVRGFYAADGNAAETSADSGNVWMVRFAPNQIGEWNYKASLRRGKMIAISDEPNAGEEVQIVGMAAGDFAVTPPRGPSSEENDFRLRGFLRVSNGYYRFGKSGNYWLKGGCDSPENFLAYEGFDGTYRVAAKARDGESKAPSVLHKYATHVADWQQGDPTWKNGKGKAIIGGVNYLSSMGVNAQYFLTFNLTGDGNDVWPYVSHESFDRFDCSKLDQWEIVFRHMQKKGMLLHVVTQETENERLLDDGDTGVLRKLYYRELIARFAHHPGLVWNLGEENGPADFSPNGQTADQQKVMASYFKKSDPYKHPVQIHTHSTAKSKDHILPALLNHRALDGLSFQVDNPTRVHTETIEWKNRAAKAGCPWIITMDEIGKWDTGAAPDSIDPNHDVLRHRVLWGSLMAGAAGVEWYFGAKLPHNDLNSEDCRQRENLWQQTSIAVEFFQAYLPFWEMAPAQKLISNTDAYCFAKSGDTYAIYVPSLAAVQAVALQLPNADVDYHVHWFDPKSGGPLKSGTVKKVRGGTAAAQLGKPPESPANDPQDWVILVRRK